MRWVKRLFYAARNERPPEDRKDFWTKRAALVLKIKEAREPNDLPSFEDITKYGTWDDLVNALGVLYAAHLRILGNSHPPKVWPKDYDLPG